MQLATPEVGFDYSQLKPELSQWLRERTGSIRLALRRSAGELLLIGQQLDQVRRELGKKHWRAWFESELSLSRRSANRMILIARLFHDVDPDLIKQIDPSALYTLCEPGVPQAAREYAVEVAGEGKRVTSQEARLIVDAYRPVRVKLKPIKKREAKRDEPLKVTPIDPVRKSLEELLSHGGMLHITTTIDNETNTTTVYGRYQPDNGNSVQVSRETVEEVIVALAGHEERIPCLRCGEAKPPGQFSWDGQRPTGRNRYCKVCERVRARQAS